MMTSILMFLSGTFLLYALSFAATTVVGSQEEEKIATPTTINNIVIAGYLPDYRSYINVNATAPYLTDLILFSLIPHSQRGMLGGCCLNDHHYQQAHEAQAFKKQQYTAATALADDGSSFTKSDDESLRIWVTVGGGGGDRSEPFAKVAADSKKRKRLIDSLMRLCEKHLINGVDLNVFTIQTQSDLNDYNSFIRDASQVLRSAGIMLSMTIHHNYAIFPSYVYDLVDRVNVMTYDMIQGKNPKTGYYNHHATPDMVEKSIQGFVDSGCPRRKLVMGIPAYARHQQNPGMVKTFAEIVDEATAEIASVDNSWNGYLYDSPETVRRKVKLAIELGLAGICFWELGQDKQHPEIAPGGILLEAAAAEALAASRAQVKEVYSKDPETNEEL